jgi:hypothetical protein
MPNTKPIKVEPDTPNDNNRPKKEPKGDETATSIEELRMNKLDPAGEIDESTGEKQFLSWKTTIEDGEEIQKAIGRDGTVYKIVEDKPPVVKNYKLVIEEEKVEPTNIRPRPVTIQNAE